MSNGRIPIFIEYSASRAERFEERTAANVATASTPVTQMLPVGDPRNGNMPSRLLNRMKKNTDQMNGRNRSAGCPAFGVSRTT